MQNTGITKNVLAPDFKLYDKEGAMHTLSQYMGQWVFLFFYPKDETPGCIKEVCAIRDVFHKFKKENVMVIGVSGDNAESHSNFSNKYKLEFVLLCDDEGVVSKKYGAWGTHTFDGKTIWGVQRETFLINPEGIVAKHYKHVVPEIHAEEVLKDLSMLKKI
jgi:peroxiredoxin Q/BCP